MYVVTGERCYQASRGVDLQTMLSGGWPDRARPKPIGRPPQLAADRQGDRGLADRPASVTAFPAARPAQTTPARIGNHLSPPRDRALVSRVGNWLTVRFRDDGVGVFGPDEGLAAFVPAVDKAGDVLDEVADRVEGAAADGLA